MATSAQNWLYGFFKGKGWSSASARGAVASLSGESTANLNTGVYQGEGPFGKSGTNWNNFIGPKGFGVAETAGGIANWNGSRATGFYNWARGNGMDPNALATQAEYVAATAPGYGRGFNTQATDYIAATNQFTRNFEQPRVVNERSGLFTPSSNSNASANLPLSTSSLDTSAYNYAFADATFYPANQSRADTLSDISQDYTDGKLNAGGWGELSTGADGVAPANMSGSDMMAYDPGGGVVMPRGIGDGGLAGPYGSVEGATEIPEVSADMPTSAEGFGQGGKGISLPGPLQELLGVGGKAQIGRDVNGQVVSGMWEATGSTATTVGANTVAKSNVEAANTVAKAQKDAADTESKTLQATTQQTNETNTANTNTLTSSAASTVDSFVTNFKDLFVRGWIGAFGLVLLAGAVLWFMRAHDAESEGFI